MDSRLGVAQEPCAVGSAPPLHTLCQALAYRLDWTEGGRQVTCGLRPGMLIVGLWLEGVVQVQG